MEKPEIQIAELGQENVAKLKELESELGAIVVAYEPSYKPAELNESQVAKLRAMEAEVGLILVAFRPE